MDSKPCRDITKVIPNMLLLIPEDEHILRNAMIVYNESLFNQSPEARTTAYCWIPVQHILQKHISVLDSEWKEKLHALFTDT